MCIESMPVYINQKGNISFLYIHIPKCGGGSIERFFRDNKYNQQLFSLNPLKLRKCSPQHMHATMLESILNIERFDYVFAVVRNPVNRIISEYKWQISRKIAKDGIDAWYDEARSLYLEDNFRFDNHMRPMHEFIVGRCHVFKLEDGLSKIPRYIESQLKSMGMDVLWDINKIGHQKRDRHQIVISKKPFLKSRYDKVIPNKATVLKILKDYEKDFIQFGYTLNPECYFNHFADNEV